MQDPTDGEVNILRVLWQRGPCTVRQILQQMNAGAAKEIGYTTVLKFVQIMTDKGLLVRDDTQRPQVYSPAIPREETQANLLSRLVNSVFEGSAHQATLRLLGSSGCPQDELTRIEKILRRVEENRK
jgi:predicted transcriptional regulator